MGPPTCNEIGIRNVYFLNHPLRYPAAPRLKCKVSTINEALLSSSLLCDCSPAALPVKLLQDLLTSEDHRYPDPSHTQEPPRSIEPTSFSLPEAQAS
jgi:hypothetical protein